MDTEADKKTGAGPKDHDSFDESDVSVEVIPSFDEMPLHTNLLRGIYSYGFEKPSAIQQRAIVPFIKGGDIIAQAQSGTGVLPVYFLCVVCSRDCTQTNTKRSFRHVAPPRVKRFILGLLLVFTLLRVDVFFVDTALVRGVDSKLVVPAFFELRARCAKIYVCVCIFCFNFSLFYYLCYGCISALFAFHSKPLICHIVTSGKTGAFAIGTLQRMDFSVKRVQALILSPTRELALQTEQVCCMLCCIHVQLLFVCAQSLR